MNLQHPTADQTNHLYYKKAKTSEPKNREEIRHKNIQVEISNESQSNQ